MRTPRNIALTVVLFGAFLCLWEAVVIGFSIPDFILPAPTRVLVSLHDGLAQGTYLRHLSITLIEALTGFAIGSLIGFGLGVVIALSKTAEFFVYPYVVMFQSIPKVALAPLVVIWFGLGMTSKIVMAVMVSFFPIMINTISGLKSVDEERLNLMAALTATRMQTLLMLRLPASLPYILAGVEIALTFALLGTIVAEFLGATAGLGMLLTSMNFSMDVAGEFSILLILSFVGLGLSSIVAWVRRKLLFWDASWQKDAGAFDVLAGRKPQPTSIPETKVAVR